MKKAARKRRRSARADIWTDARDGFVKGFVSTGLLAALRDGNDSRRILVAALQGGTALAAASVAAGAIGRGDTPTTLAAVAAGSAGLAMIGRMADDNAAGASLTEYETTGDQDG